ncbi:malonyl CoA-ACP transacylase, partial [Neisseria arctica]
MMNAEDAGPINDSVNTQPLMVAAGVATYRAFLEAGGQAPKVVAGHSFGEYAALVVAGALKFENAGKLLRLRAELM